MPCTQPAIPFEGLIPSSAAGLDRAPTIADKLLHRRRGGYCHEQNALFYRVLPEIGFRVAPLGARVVWMTPGATHR